MIDTRLHRNMFDPRLTGCLNQGSIFNFAYNEDYSESKILGLVISARCDIAQEKVNKYCYLSTIPLEIWKQKEMPLLLKGRVFKNIENGLFQKLEAFGISKNSLQMYSLERIKEVAILQNKEKTFPQLEAALSKYSLFIGSIGYERLTEKFEKDIIQIFDEIITNKNSDLFFIDNVGKYGPCIVKLRDVNYLDSKIADKLPEGIELPQDFTDDCHEYRAINLRLAKGDLVEIVGLLLSPYTELLMQRFANNFTRVGVDDPHSDLAKSLL